MTVILSIVYNCYCRGFRHASVIFILWMNSHELDKGQLISYISHEIYEKNLLRLSPTVVRFHLPDISRLPRFPVGGRRNYKHVTDDRGEHCKVNVLKPGGAHIVLLGIGQSCLSSFNKAK